MNILDLHNNGHPLLIEDLLHIQKAYTTALSGILSAFYDGSNYADYGIILSGCQILNTGLLSGTINVSEGYLAYQNEVFYVPAHSFEATGFVRKDELQFELIENYEGIQPVTYADGSQQYTRRVREMRMYHTQTGSASSVVVANTFANVQFALATITSPDNTGSWELIKDDKLGFSVSMGVDMVGGTAIIEDVNRPWRVKKNHLGIVTLQGRFSALDLNGETSLSGELFTLKEAYRPSSKLTISNRKGDFDIDIDGKITYTYYENGFHSFNNIIFTVD